MTRSLPEIAGMNAKAVYSALSIMSSSKPSPKDLLLAPQLPLKQAAHLLERYGLHDSKKADANLQAIAADPATRLLFSGILEDSLEAFSDAADPDQALNNFERFCQAAFSKTALLSFLKHSPLTLWRAAQIFGGSCFLSDILIRHPELFYWVFDPATLQKVPQKSTLRKALRRASRLKKEKKARLDMLRIFKRKEMLRIGVRDLLRIATVEETFKDLSNLADVCIERAYAICEAALRQKYGSPLKAQALESRPRLCVFALGKLGSRELNFSSDVDLIYLYPNNEGQTSGGKGRISLQNRRYFEQLAKDMTAALNAPTEEGYVYRVDLRLRPEGEQGLIALPLEAYRRYYEKRGETWERLVLLRARCVAGDSSLAKAFLEMLTPFVYGRAFGKAAISDIRRFKDRIDAKIALNQLALRDVKRGFGGIREIEFVLHALQLRHGADAPQLRKQGTLQVLKLLGASGQLAPEHSRFLAVAYRFLRDVENKIQMLNDQQTHLLPDDPAQLQALARRLGYRDRASASATAELKADYRRQTAGVHKIYKAAFPEA